MKKIFKVTTLVAVISFTSYQLLAQPAPGVQSGNGPVLGGPIGGGAPIGNGTLLLLGLVGLYGMKRVYSMKQNNNAE
jgi:hypothetical protein